MTDFERRYFEDPDYAPGLKGGDEVRGYGYYPDYFPVVEAQLATLVELTSARTLLDAGCGKGALAAWARRDLGVCAVGADASAYAVLHARGGAACTVRADVARLPFAAAAFDLVYCNGVLQYLDGFSARAALAELARVCGRAAFISNIAAVQRTTDWGRADTLTRLYLRPRQWAELLRAAAASPGSSWAVAALPFEGESAMLLFQPSGLGPLFPLRFVELALERMRRLGASVRTPPALASWSAALPGS